MSCGVGRRRGSDPALLWLWRRLVAMAPIRPLVWEPPYAAGTAQEMAKRQKKKKKKESYIPTILMNTVTKILNKILGNQIQQCTKNHVGTEG